MKAMLGIISTMLLAGLVSCEGFGGAKVGMDQVYKFNDSLPTVISSISTIQTRVDESQRVKVIIGSESLYDASQEKKQEAAVTAGKMALNIFGTDVVEGTMIVTKDIQNHQEDPADGIQTDMKLDSLKKALFRK
jgi:hypothetical protein